MRYFVVFSAALLLTFLFASQAEGRLFTTDDERVIVDLSELSIGERDAYLDSIVMSGGRIIYRMDELNHAVIVQPGVLRPFARGVMSLQMANLPTEPDGIAYALDQFVNDPLYNDQWALAMIDAPLAWAHLPINTPVVRVAVIDSGVCLHHIDLAGRLLPGWDYIDDDDTPIDLYDHGCGVAGIIAANHNDGFGIAGVAPNAHILPYRVLDANGIGRYSDIAQAILQAVADGADIINLSLGGTQSSNLLEQAVNYAVEQDVIVVAATGNTGQEGVFYPAAYSAVMAIGSATITGERSATSTYGPQVTGHAPGENVVITSTNGGHRTNSGTSFASAYASGLIALALAWDTSPVIGSDSIVRFDLGVLACPADVNGDGVVTQEDVELIASGLLPNGDVIFTLRDSMTSPIGEIQRLLGYLCDY